MNPLRFFNLVLKLYLLNFGACKQIPSTVEIPLGGNGYITTNSDSSTDAIITDDGLGNWRDTKTICSVYFKLTKSETFQVALRLKVSSGMSTIRVSIKSKNYVTPIAGTELYIQKIGQFSAKKGYARLLIQGVTKTGVYFGDVAQVILSGVTGKVVYIADKKNFLYGRRGPSVHLFNTEPQDMETTGVEYFYNEVTIPANQDIVGCYFMANGFSNGYFGIQRNTESEKNILFSVFSDFKINDPSMVMQEYMIRVLKKGKGVTDNSFGNEGSGIQCYLKYQWQTDVTYKFLIRGKPVPSPDTDSTNTTYTAWFKAPGSKWQLIASLQKPKVNTNLTDLYSFSENFLPDQGYIQRMGYFGNQWARATDGKWSEVFTAQFTDDETGETGKRDDFSGGLSQDRTQFFLKNIGFFNENTKTGTYFTRNATGNGPPNVVVKKLP